jgi:hypothetical protein
MPRERRVASLCCWPCICAQLALVLYNVNTQSPTLGKSLHAKQFIMLYKKHYTKRNKAVHNAFFYNVIYTALFIMHFILLFKLFFILHYILLIVHRCTALCTAIYTAFCTVRVLHFIKYYTLHFALSAYCNLYSIL